MEYNDADQIIPRLWLGNAKSSLDDDFIHRNGITVVFNCTKNLPFSPNIPISYRVPVDDNLQEEEIRNMELWSAEIAFKLLREYKRGRTILVHCYAGMQRSAAAVAFLLIAIRRTHMMDAIQFIKSKRPIAFHPKANFGRSIDYFDRWYHSEIMGRTRQIEDGFRMD
jgi:rhodanese-related sulfurtransferase